MKKLSLPLIITVNHYRLVTGACEAGVKDWMSRVFNDDERANVLDNGIKAVDLMPILKRNSAYGFDRFKALVTFE
jgi:hypothetical protein